MKIKIGVMGSAFERGEGRIEKKSIKLAQQVGRAIANHNCILINGACGGIPHEAAVGAKEADGMVIGISPARDYYEHVVHYKFPIDEFDMIFYTGFGFKGRNVVNVSNCDAIIIIAGHAGTLNEFSIGYDEGMIIGVMQGSGGLADFVDDVLNIVKKKTCAKLIYETDPHILVTKVIKAVKIRKIKEEQLSQQDRKKKFIAPRC